MFGSPENIKFIFFIGQSFFIRVIRAAAPGQVRSHHNTHLNVCEETGVPGKSLHIHAPSTPKEAGTEPEPSGFEAIVQLLHGTVDLFI